MGTLSITELALVTHGSTLVKQPALRAQTVEIENESAMSAPFTTGAQLVEIVADVPCRVVFGEDPEATQNHPAAVHWRNAKALGMMLETSRKLGAEGGRRRWSAADACERTKHAQVMARARWRSHCRRLKERAQASAAAWR